MCLKRKLMFLYIYDYSLFVTYIPDGLCKAGFETPHALVMYFVKNWSASLRVQCILVQLLP